MTPENLEDLMKTHGLNVKKVASVVKSSGSCVYMWLAGKRRIPELKWDCLQRYVTESVRGKVLRFDSTWSVQ